MRRTYALALAAVTAIALAGGLLGLRLQAASPAATVTPGPGQAAPIAVTPAPAPKPSATVAGTPEGPTSSPRAAPPSYFPARGNERVPVVAAPQGPPPAVVQVRDSHGNVHTLPVLPADRR